MLKQHTQKLKNKKECKMNNIKLIATDIDGVWTDAKMYYTNDGDFMKAFSTYDGMAADVRRGPRQEVIPRESACVSRRDEDGGPYPGKGRRRCSGRRRASQQRVPRAEAIREHTSNGGTKTEDNAEGPGFSGWYGTYPRRRNRPRFP